MIAAESIAAIAKQGVAETAAFARFERRCRRTFLASFWGGALIKRAVSSPLPDWMAVAGKPLLKRFATQLAS
jgi:hypothetical protein